ncbi:MAG: glucose 1-dehydrogenase [Acidimicrobiia bacterium]|nr:glucose 1-dehydrogenase [Acidimicrobiia bacterium]
MGADADGAGRRRAGDAVAAQAGAPDRGPDRPARARAHGLAGARAQRQPPPGDGPAGPGLLPEGVPKVGGQELLFVTEHGVAGRVVIVTGAGQGIGRGIALHLGRNGASVVVAEWKEHRATRTAAELEALGTPALAAVCDVSSKAQVEAMVAAAAERFGRIDAIVNNAQTFRPQAPLASVGGEDVDVFYESGVKGTLWGMQAVHPHMQRAGWGRIVNVASAAGITGMPGYGAYNASKEAIRALTRTAAREWGRDGVVVNCICPGAASKRGTDAAAREEEAHRDFMRDHPVGRLGDPEGDIAPVVLFLCSDACRYLTGQTLMVDGGAFLVA